MNGRAQYDKPFLFNTCKKDHSRTFDMEVKRLITITGKLYGAHASKCLESRGYVEPPQSKTQLELRKRYRTALENSPERVEYKVQYEQWALEVKKTKNQWERVFPMMVLAMTDSLRSEVERSGKFAAIELARDSGALLSLCEVISQGRDPLLMRTWNVSRPLLA